MFTEIYHVILYEPIFNLLVFFYNLVGDIGLAIILLTIVIKILLSPFFIQSVKSQRAMQAIQPKLDELKEKYKDKKEELGPAIMQLYKKEKVSPFSSCLPLLIQFPFLIAVFQVFRIGLIDGGALNNIYPFITNPGTLNVMSLGILDMGKSSILIAVLAGIAQFWQSKTMMAKRQPTVKANQNNMASTMTKQMMYMMPIITVFIGSSLPAGLTFYWFLTTLLGAVQQVYVFKKMDQNFSFDKSSEDK